MSRFDFAGHTSRALDVLRHQQETRIQTTSGGYRGPPACHAASHVRVSSWRVARFVPAAANGKYARIRAAIPSAKFVDPVPHGAHGPPTPRTAVGLNRGGDQIGHCLRLIRPRKRGYLGAQTSPPQTFNLVNPLGKRRRTTAAHRVLNGCPEEGRTFRKRCRRWKRNQGIWEKGRGRRACKINKVKQLTCLSSSISHTCIYVFYYYNYVSL